MSYATRKKKKKDIGHRERLSIDLLDPKDGYFINRCINNLTLIYLILYSTLALVLGSMVVNVAGMVGISKKIVSFIFFAIYSIYGYYGSSKFESMLLKDNKYFAYFKEFSKNSKTWHRRRIALPTILVISSYLLLLCVSLIIIYLRKHY